MGVTVGVDAFTRDEREDVGLLGRHSFVRAKVKGVYKCVCLGVHMMWSKHGVCHGTCGGAAVETAQLRLSRLRDLAPKICGCVLFGRGGLSGRAFWPVGHCLGGKDCLSMRLVELCADGMK